MSDSFGRESLESVVNDGKLPKAVASTYLRLYVAEVEWDQHIAVLYSRLKKKYSGESLNEMVRNVISCTILLRAVQSSVPLDETSPESLLFSVHKFHQFGEQDWFARLQKVIKRDLEIQEWRKQVLSLGVVDPIDFQPYYRQAFNWMFEKAEKTGSLKDQNKELLDNRFRRLVQAYGGSVICNMFTRHDEAIKRVLNWRSGYFLERQIFQVYNVDQIMKIKKLELDKTNAKLVKKVTYA